MKKYVISGICILLSICLLLGAVFLMKKDDVTENDTPVGISATTDYDFSILSEDTDSVYEGTAVNLNEVTDKLNITTPGSYKLSGNLNGQVVVNVSANENVRLILSNANIENENGPAINIIAADKVFITLDEDSENTLTDGKEYDESYTETNANGALFSKEDLVINGEGSLSVTGNYRHGIVSRDDLIIAGGNITVTAVEQGLHGKDCVKFTAANLEINAGTDGIQSDNTEVGRGYIYVNSGIVKINATEKGIQAENYLYVENGTVTVNSTDDCLHSNGEISIQNGNITVSGEDDGLHADGDLNILGGYVTVNKSYEGLEGNNVYIKGGEHYIVASDDGINAAGGSDTTQTDKHDFFMGGNNTIDISGGYTVVNGGGDGIDSNGTINMTNGTLIIYGPTDNGNSAVDWDTNGYISGGNLIALGSSGMAENPSGDAYSLLYNGDTISVGTRITLADENGNVIASTVAVKECNSVLISTPNMAENAHYVVYTGGEISESDQNGNAFSGTIQNGTQLYSYTQSETHFAEGATGFGGNMGGMQGGMRGGMQNGTADNQTGEVPELPEGFDESQMPSTDGQMPSTDGGGQRPQMQGGNMGGMGGMQ